MAIQAADGHERHAFWGRPPGLRPTASSAPRRLADRAECPTWTFYGVPMALRAAYRHESQRAFQSRDRKRAVSCRVELVTFYGVMAEDLNSGSIAETWHQPSARLTSE